ncbi:histidine-specific methyltransferase [Xylaria castorea]|nr:histidine-specific methyltransferase [Xylaria castorea]
MQQPVTPKNGIIDIRSDTHGIDMKDNLLLKLRPGKGEEKQIPTILLYDEAGLKLFEEITYLDEYYLTNAEIELLETRAAEMVRKLTPGSIIVELGSGNLRKTGILLAALDKLGVPFEYFALDLSFPELERTLSAVPAYNNVRTGGLHGTYDDGMAWLLRPENRATPKCILSLGSSLGNFPCAEATQFLTAVGSCLTPGRDCILIGLDGCRDPDIVYSAYNDRDGVTRKFILNGLSHANKVLGEKIFDIDDWEYVGEYDEKSGRHRAFVSPTTDVTYRDIFIQAGERLLIEESYKYSANQTTEMWAVAGFTEVARWGPTRKGLPYYVRILFLVLKESNW